MPAIQELIPGAVQRFCVRHLYSNFRKKYPGKKLKTLMWRIALLFQKISEKLSRNNFFLKFHVRIWTEFGTKRHKFHVKRMSIHLGKKSNSFTHKRTFLSTLTVMNKKFIENLVGRIWVSNLSQTSIHTMTNFW